MKKLLRIVAILLGLGALIAAGLFGYLYFVVLDNPFDNKEFNRELWIDFHDRDELPNPRGEMLEDLTNNHLHKGMKKEEVINLLGLPDYIVEDNLIRYELGLWAGFNVNTVYLHIEFSSADIATNIYTVQH